MDKNRKKLLEKFIKKCKIQVNNLDLLNQAFFHSSYINEVDSYNDNNEKLEFLGDAVLALITVELLYKKFPNRTEGELSRIKSLLVSSTALSQFAKSINLSRYLLLGKGEILSGGSTRPSLLADTFEAVLGALYLDTGINTVINFVRPMLLGYLDKIEKDEHVRDYKTRFQLIVQQKFKCVPIYETIKEDGPDHSKIFFVQVCIGKRICGQGQGKSKKVAQQEAAKEAIKKLNIDFNFKNKNF